MAIVCTKKWVQPQEHQKITSGRRSHQVQKSIYKIDYKLVFGYILHTRSDVISLGCSRLRTCVRLNTPRIIDCLLRLRAARSRSLLLVCVGLVLTRSEHGLPLPPSLNLLVQIPAGMLPPS